MQGYRVLDWDSNFFGFKIGLITTTINNADQFSALFNDVKTSEIKLLYWPTLTRADETTESLIENLGGGLMDEKVTFIIDLPTISASLNREVETYSSNMSLEQLCELAIQSGEFSRFAVDKKIPREKYEELYRKWIKSSVNKQLADEVLVIRESGRLVGMATLGEKNNRGDIGLLAVHSNYRGKKYGEALVRASLQWFNGKNYKMAQVVTQGKNLAACNLYKKCGYRVEKTEYYYHIWL